MDHSQTDQKPKVPLDDTPTMNVSAFAPGESGSNEGAALVAQTAPDGEALPDLIDREEEEELRYFEEEELPEPEADPAESYPAIPTKEQKAPKLQKPIPDFRGLFHAFSDSARNPALTVLSFLACALLWLTVIALLTFVYLCCLFAAVSAMLLLTLISIAVIAGGLAGFAYALIMLFTSDLVVALIEIGLGTMLIGVVLAISGLLYELIAAQLPKLIRLCTRLFGYGARYFTAFFFGAHKRTVPAPAAREGRQ